MSLKDRLSRLTGDAGKPVQSDPKQEKLSDLRRKIDEVMSRREHFGSAQTPPAKHGAIPLEQVVSGEEVKTSHGKFFFSRSSLKAKDSHGHARVCDLACASMEAAAFLSGHDGVKNLSLEDGLFLDTETTGLAGGTGTFPFLIGLGWFENGGFITCQLFARDFSEEPSMLAHLCELASARKFLVSFNGRAYDLNLLAARFILNRFSNIFSGMPHIDLLHPSRRIYSHRLENARLVTLEASVLGVRRENDVPGYEIPQRYFDWLRRKDGRLMQDVFCHNRLDVISMASLLKHMTDLVEDKQDILYAHHSDILSVARIHHDRGNLAKAKPILERLSQSNQPDVSLIARKFLSLIYKKISQWDDAVCLWKEMIAIDPHDVFACVELAKWYEHHVREFDHALEIVHRILDGERNLNEPDRLAMEHRLRRLLHKTASR